LPQGGAYSQGIGYRSQGLLLMIRVVRGFIHRGIIPTALIHFAPRSIPLALFQDKHLTNQWVYSYSDPTGGIRYPIPTE
jgi:hypothetical protein